MSKIQIPILSTSATFIRTCEGKFHRVFLSAPDGYWKTAKTKIVKDYNGMGPDIWWCNIIPQNLRNQILLLDVRECAYIHDWMYSVIVIGWTKEQYLEYKKLADNLFLANLKAIINDNYAKEKKDVVWFKFLQKWFIYQRYLARIKAAKGCYELVVTAGDKYFLKNKGFV